MSTIRLMSQNQWNYTNNSPDWEEKGLDCSAEVRMHGHVQVFKDVMPDIMGGQEVNKEMQLFFKLYCIEEKLPYTIIWGNMTPIIYRADKFELLDTEYLLYPKYMEGSEKGFNDSNSKSMNMGVFREKATGKVFIFATTHLWWRSNNPNWWSYQEGSEAARVYQMQLATALLKKYQDKYDGCPIIFGGDMNTTYNTAPIQYALNEAGYQHAFDVATDFRSDVKGECACGPKGPATQWIPGTMTGSIDHILVKDVREGSVKRFDRYCPDYYFSISDHAPVFIDIEI